MKDQSGMLINFVNKDGVSCYGILLQSEQIRSLLIQRKNVVFLCDKDFLPIKTKDEKNVKHIIDFGSYNVIKFFN